MRVAIIQPNYLPWRGYFDIIGDVDLFVFLDDTQYTRRDWRNRNRIKTREGLKWIIVPVQHAPRNILIKDVTIDESHNWCTGQLNQLREAYGKAPYFNQYYPQLEVLLRGHSPNLCDFAIQTVRWGMYALGIHTPLVRSSQLGSTGSKQEKILNILRATGASAYVSGPAARDYLCPDAFERAGIDLLYKVYQYPEYNQLWGGFEPGVSIIDLLFNLGPGAAAVLKSQAALEHCAQPVAS